jgi:predicted Ser/Thr protein kinase
VSAARPSPPDADTWRRINDIFHRAVDIAPAGREAFVEGACAGDEAVRAEVLSLLAAHARADAFIEQPAASAADLAEAAAMAGVLTGRTIGQYRVERVLGEGGMGVVYLAHDERLGRTVALKALPARFTADPDRRERLVREARAVAALTHPGIATVYALEEIGGHFFIASEYVPGETLRGELARGPLTVTQTLDTAILVARVLAAAHDRGVVHRDLKPENLIRTPGGDVKVLDFGLALIRRASGDDARLTGDGTRLGTPGYMSPEQIRGADVDARSDVFSLGIVMYELVTGRHPFAGVDSAATLARILEFVPPRLASSVTIASGEAAQLGELDRIVNTCLQKSPDARYQSAHEVLGALESARQGLTVPSGGSRGRHMTPPEGLAPASWWWKFHQGAASIGYFLLLVPLWLAREWIGGRAGLLLFAAGLVAAVAATILRLHLWFTVRSYPDEWADQRARTSIWIRLADLGFVVVLGGAGLSVMDLHASAALVLIGAAVAVFLSSTIIEPATTRAFERAMRGSDGGQTGVRPVV